MNFENEIRHILMVTADFDVGDSEYAQVSVSLLHAFTDTLYCSIAMLGNILANVTNRHWSRCCGPLEVNSSVYFMVHGDFLLVTV